MADTRVVIGDGGSLILNISGLQDDWIKGNKITSPEDDAKITDVDIMPDVQDELIPHSKISWNVMLPHLTGDVVKKVEVQSDVAGSISIAIDADKRLQVRWHPPRGSNETFANWTRDDQETLRTPDNLKAARIKKVLIDASELTFTPKPGKHTQVTVVSWGALFPFHKGLRTKAASIMESLEKARETVEGRGK